MVLDPSSTYGSPSLYNLQQTFIQTIPEVYIKHLEINYADHFCTEPTEYLSSKAEFLKTT